MISLSKIAYVELLRCRKIQQKTGRNAQNLNEGGNTIVVDAESAPALGRVPVFLPWETGACVRTTIPDVATLAGQTDSHLFFTAAISGCSIFFQGTARNPAIFHARPKISPGLTHS
jgi:hypothetical protein